MLRSLKERKGQSIAEYALLFAVVLGAYIGLQSTIKMNLQSKVKDALDYTKTVSDGILKVNGKPFVFTDKNKSSIDVNTSTQTKRTQKKEKGQLDGGTELTAEDSISETYKTETAK